MSLDAIEAALEKTANVTPPVVVGAFAPEADTVFGLKLLPVTLGMWLVLEKIAHPIITRHELTDYDFASALFVLTRPSNETLEAIRTGEFETKVYDLAENVTLGEFARGLALIQQALDMAFKTALPMRAEGGTQKKTEASAGG